MGLNVPHDIINELKDVEVCILSTAPSSSPKAL